MRDLPIAVQRAFENPEVETPRLVVDPRLVEYLEQRFPCTLDALPLDVDVRHLAFLQGARALILHLKSLVQPETP